MISELLSGSQPRGLHNFISDIRNATSKDDERARVDKELANIRAKFSNSAQLTAYQRKKYVWKMCYIHTLGYDIDFGQMEFVSLMASSKYTEKSVGYMAASLILRPGDEMMNLAVNSIRNDLRSNINFAKCLALIAISNIGGRELTEALSSDVQDCVVPPAESIPTYNVGPHNNENVLQNKNQVCKKACMCLLRIFRINPDCIDLKRDWVSKMARLLEDQDIGVVTGAMNLLIGLASANQALFEPLVPYVISLLTRLVIDRNCPADYLYYRTPSPWLHVKCLKFLQLYRVPERSQAKLLNTALHRIIDGTENTDNPNKANGDNSILFEALNLVLSYGSEGDPDLRTLSHNLLGRFLTYRDPNIRYLALDALTRLAHIDGPTAVQSHQRSVLDSLRDVDISIRMRSLDLIFAMTDSSNSKEIVDELITILTISDAALKEDIVVKIAILAEKFASSWTWYIDSMSRVILVAGEHVAEAVWYRIVQIVLNSKDIHDYTAEKMLVMAQNKYAPEISVAMSAYLLGEIGVNICTKSGMSGYDQFATLHQHFSRVSHRVQSILLTTYVKFINLYPDTREIITEVFEKYSTSSNLEIQQRACEYLMLPKVGSHDLLEKVLEDMPAYSGDKSNLHALLQHAKEDIVKPLPTQGGASSTAREVNPDLTVPDDYVPHVPGGYAQAAAASSNNNNGGLVDLLSLHESPSSGGGVGIPSDVMPKLRPWWSQAALSPPSQRVVLYEDTVVRLSYTGDFRQHQARLGLQLYNKGGSELTDVRITVSISPDSSAVVIRTQDPATRVPIADEARSQVALDCMRPFADPLSLGVSFTVGGSPHRYTLSLPVTANSFFEPISVDKDAFMTRWKSLVGEGLEQQEVFQCGRGPLDTAMIQHIRSVVIPGLRMGPVPGIDTENTVTAGGSFRTGTQGPDGALIAIGALLRIEADVHGNRFRVTVRAKHPVIAQAVKNTIKLILGPQQ